MIHYSYYNDSIIILIYTILDFNLTMCKSDDINHEADTH